MCRWIIQTFSQSSAKIVAPHFRFISAQAITFSLHHIINPIIVRIVQNFGFRGMRKSRKITFQKQCWNYSVQLITDN